MAGLSVGGAAAQGLESGIGLGLGMRRQQLAEEADKRASLQADQVLERQKAQDARLEDDRALDAINKSFEDIRSEGEGLIQQYGGIKNIPEDVGADYRGRQTQVSGARDTLLRKRYEPLLAQQQQRAKDIAMNLQSGKVDIGAVSPADLYHAVMVQTRRDPSDLLSKDGQPSKLSTAVSDIHDGIQYGNEGAVLRGANVLFAPELQVGVGEPSPHGGTIVGKQIVKLVPHPADPNKVLPVVKVFVRSGLAKTAGDVDRAEHVAEEGVPLGAIGYYIAPITENRSSHPDDPPKAIDLNQAMEYAAQMQTLSTALDHPEVRSKLEQGAKEAGSGKDDFTKAFYAVRGKMPAKSVEYKSVKKDEKLVGIDTQTGKPTGAVIEGERSIPKATGLAANIQAVKDYAEANDIDEDEAAQQLQAQGLLRAPKAGKAAKGVADGGPMPPKGLTGKDLLDSLNEDDAITVQGLADGTLKPSEISQKGNRREKMLALAKRFDPSSDWGANGKLKDVPAPAQKAMLENNTNINRVQRALRLIGALPTQEGEEADPNATGLKGLLPGGILNRVDPKGVEARAAIADLGSLVIHDRSGAAVSASEFPRLAPFIPSANDDAATVKKKLTRFYEVYKQEMDALQGTYGPDNGYKEFKVGGDSGAGTPREKPPAAAAPAAGGAPFRLPSDRAAAAAAYNKLPSGATFVDPDGNTRRKP